MFENLSVSIYYFFSQLVQRRNPAPNWERLRGGGIYSRGCPHCVEPAKADARIENESTISSKYIFKHGF